jgi:CRISPR-associated protein Cmr3
MESIPFVQEMLQAPHDIVENIAKTKHCRLVLLTPASFQQGFAPYWPGLARHGVTPEVRAMVVKRPLVVSGWDMEKSRPKPSTRLAPAGSVYYLSLQGSPDGIEAWVRDMWFQCISDEQPEQFRNDGFGIAVMGAWSGKIEEIKRERQ